VDEKRREDDEIFWGWLDRYIEEHAEMQKILELCAFLEMLYPTLDVGYIEYSRQKTL
jgi:hypothetical protein